MNLFATVLTYPALQQPIIEERVNRTALSFRKLQTDGWNIPSSRRKQCEMRFEKSWRAMALPCNRSRLHDEEQLAVRFADYPNPEEYIDDFFFGYLVAASSADRKKILDELKKDERDFRFKRDSILRMNLAKGIEPYRHDSVFTQSPRNSEDSPWKNADDSALLHRETVQTAFQYPFALNLNQCESVKFKKTTGEDKEIEAEGLRYLLKAIGELSGVAGNHARSYYEMAPASIVIRLSESLVAGYNTYGFTKEGDFPEVIDGIREGDYPADEFFIGGKIVKDMSEESTQALEKQKVTLDRSAQRLITTVTEKILGRGAEE